MIQKVKSINVKKFTTAQSQQFLMNSYGHMTASEKLSEKFAADISAFQIANEEFDDQLKKLRVNLKTKDVVAAKKRVGKAYSVVHNMIRCLNIISPTDALAKSAYKMKLLIDNYQIKPKMDMSSLSDLIYNLTTDLSSDEYSADVKALGLDTWVKSLIHENDEYLKVMKNRTQEMLPKGTRHLWASRKKAEEAYRQVIQHLNAVLLVQDTTDYDSFVSTQNLEIQFQKQSVIGQNKRVKTLEEKQDKEPSKPTSDATLPTAPSDEADGTESSQEETSEQLAQ